MKDENLKQIVVSILRLAEDQQHPDKVACIHSVLMQINMLVGEKMRKVRELGRTAHAGYTKVEKEPIDGG